MSKNPDSPLDLVRPDPQALAVLPPPERAAVALQSSVAEQHLRGLIAKTADITNVIDKNGRDEAHRAGMSLKNARVAVVNTGKTVREDAVAFQKAVVAEADRLAAITADEEARLFGLRDAFDEKVAAEKAERERIEAERVATIRKKLASIAASPAQHAGENSIVLTQALQTLAQLDLSAGAFHEFTGEARTAVDTAAAALIVMRNTALEREEAARQEKLRLEAAARKAEEDAHELARLNAELLERTRREQAEAAAREAAAQVERNAAAARERAMQEEMAAMRAQMAAMQAAANPAPEPEPEPAKEPGFHPITQEQAGALAEQIATVGVPTITAFSAPAENARPDDDDAVAVMLKYVRELHEIGTRTSAEILDLVSDELDALDAGEGK